jgi:hypothetical protein
MWNGFEAKRAHQVDGGVTQALRTAAAQMRQDSELIEHPR